MTDLVTSSRVRELQAMLFPIQPIPGNALTSFEGLQGLHVGRFDNSRRETEELSPFSLSLGGNKYHHTGEALQALLDARCVIDGITQEAARWPTECQVIPERIRHIEYNPTTPEPYYAPTGREPRPKPLGEELGTVMFHYCPTSVTNYFSRSCVGGDTVLPYPAEYSSRDDGNIFFVADSGTYDANSDLKFESRFESGNLGKVVKITDTYYQLHLRKDLYTQRHTQWYYFRISNTRSRTTYRLSIVNLCKDESLYNEGLRPLLYSTEDAKTRSVGWRRCGDNIAYYRNDSSSDEEKERHTLTFNVSFPHDRDTVYLAHCYPYTYSDLQEYLAKIAADPVKTRFTKLRLLCRSLAGNGIYYLTITAPSYEDEARRKRGVVITARVHPGETPSSWMMKGIIDFLTGESNQAKELRERFVFKLVPMLNPDGVIVGNNRCSLSGKDLNRQYRTVMRESYPSVWHTKLMVRRLLEECGIAIYCDLHAHSRKHNIFAYGCESKRAGCYARLSEQVFPLMLHKNAADKFSFENCKFHMDKGKEGTGRVVVWSMGVQNSYTMEASMGGSKIGSRTNTHFSTQDYEQIGRAFCETLLDFFDEDPTKERLRMKIVARLVKEGSSAEVPTNIDLTDYSSDEGDTSDSTTSEKESGDFTDWPYEEKESLSSTQYLSAPPPSPTYLHPRSIELSKRRLKKRISMGKSYLQKRKYLTHRAVMDLPTTDPASDFYDPAESTDEVSTKREELSDRQERLYREEIIYQQEEEEKKKKRAEGMENLILPEIVRPRSVSLGENLLVAGKNERRIRKQSPCMRLTRALRNHSPVSLKGQDIQIKLSSLRKQIWMGVPMSQDENNDLHPTSAFVRRPLSWGVSNLALAQCRSNSVVFIKSVSKKLEPVEYTRSTAESRKSRKKGNNKHGNAVPELAPDTEAFEDAHQSFGKKKKSRLKWQKTVNLGSKIKETYNGKGSYLTIKADSMKLVTIRTPAKNETKPQRLENQRNYRKAGLISPEVSGVTKSTIAKLQRQTQVQAQPHAQFQKRSKIRLASLGRYCETSSSEDESGDSRKVKVTKKKQKKKKQQKKVRPAPKKRVPNGKVRDHS